MKELDNVINRLKLAITDCVQVEPRREDFKELGDYIYERTIYRRFPNGLNEPTSHKFSRSAQLNKLWEWADGEKSSDFLVTDLRFLSKSGSEEVFNRDLANAPARWYRTKIPIFAVRESGYIYICIGDKKIYFIDFDDQWNYLVADSLSIILNYVAELVEYNNSHESRLKFSFIDLENEHLSLAKNARIDQCYPFTVSKETKFEV